jgi:hypothetical protein
MQSNPTLIADLVRAGLDPDLVARVAAALSGTVRDNVRDIVREYERSRKELQRKNPTKSGGKQTMSALGSEAETTPNVPDKADNRCDLSSFLSSSSEGSKRRKERKKEEQAKRATRLVAGQAIEEAEWQFARDLGHHDSAIKAMWVEFVDYWIGIPGSRGTKLDWPATWRNRVRQLSAKKQVNGHGTGSPTMEAFDWLIDRTAGETGDSSPPMVDITPRGGEKR